ncbi:MAG: hypothetical protein U5K70_07465 [Halodesulfurarchaeum sp.]|nr:hypothetical protein [Halodesulfurarchaeum sp.]
MRNMSVASVRTAFGRTHTATMFALRRRDAAVVFGAVSAVYLSVYLWMINHLATGLGNTGMTVIADPFGKFLQPELGPFMFTPIARVTVGPITYLFSFNTVLGGSIALLVGLNLALTYLVWMQPKACGIGRSSSGFLASIPALLSGTACCGPVVLIMLGIQASSTLLTAFQLLLPVSVTLLVGSLVLVGRQVRPQPG